MYEIRPLKSVTAVTMALAAFAGLAAADDSAGLPAFGKAVRPLINQYCLDCHGPDLQEGDFRIDQLNPDLVAGPDAETWDYALDRINAGEMPPEDSAQPSDAERLQLVDWLTGSLELAKASHANASGLSVRRLTKAQYSFSLQELLGVPIDFGQLLPDDGKSEMGFSNSGEVLQVSSLHVEYYQAIAREALSKAIFTGEQPPVFHYRLKLGEDIGEETRAAEIRGYQSAPIPRRHIRVEILKDGEVVDHASVSKRGKKELRDFERNLGIGMRGSSSDRYEITSEGLLLFGARPHREVAPKSWQGPSPNMKLLVRRVFPTAGPFVLRVNALRPTSVVGGYLGLYPTDGAEPIAHLDDETAKLVVPEGATVFRAVDAKKRINLEHDGDLLRPEVAPQVSTTQYTFKAPASGFYQIDLVHPLDPNIAMPSAQIRLNDSQIDYNIDPDTSTNQGLAVSSLANAYLLKGQHELIIGGNFFVGFREIVVSPLPADHQLVKQLQRKNNQATDAVPSLRAFIGNRTDDGMEYRTFDGVRVVDTPPGEVHTYEFREYLENMPIPVVDDTEKTALSNIMIAGVWNDCLTKSPRDYGPPVVIDSIEFEGPSYSQWPPQSHTQIFFDSPLREQDLEAYTRELLSRFVSRAFRRPATEAEIEKYFQFWQSIRDDYDQYEAGVQETLVAVLVSPHFLYQLPPDERRQADFALATRLSLFLWNSPPDQRLTMLAEQGKLRDQIDSEVERMLADERAWRFVRSFTREWLRMDRHEDINTDVDRYRDYTRFVKRDMADETYHFMHHVLSENLSVMNLIDSDFAMLNQNLAEFYGIQGVRGGEFRPVSVTPDQQRGGLLSQGSFLNGHSDGVQPHAIKRAVWLKEKILGDPPPPPPPNVPELNPDTPGFEKLTLKEQLEIHRDKASCRDCHKSIDPYGVVFESYDAVGRLQTKNKGRPVDTKSTLPDGTQVDGVLGMKAYILAEGRQAFRRSLAEHLLAYAIGRDIKFTDDAAIDEIVGKLSAGEDKFQVLIKAIVASRPFSAVSIQTPAADDSGESPSEQ